ncbi:MAG: N-acetylmuramoyl-L-alanine amidase, partial [Acidimicrobiia bacterium]|nr:N-acetylmuramoyl-L-alanine amidase [Acidimicrobiia bacterium]
MPDEEDVRFLLVHHSVNGNDYAAADVPALLADIFAFHTSPDRGWPDIAYNFFVDRFGGVWEGRSGSVERAKAADATGGSQGFAQLCCLLGDHRTEPASDAALASLVALLAWLASRHGLDVAPGATATFVSRGSNRHPAGVEVTTATISGHRDMSTTACPGDAVYGLIVDGTLAGLVVARQDPLPASTTVPPTTAPPPTAPPSTVAPTTLP